MSERLQVDLSRAEEFQALHVHLRTDHETYSVEMLEQWKENAEKATKEGKSIRPFWLRRTDEMGSEFGAVIDYILPTHEGFMYLAAIDIDGSGGQTDISVIMPSEDGSNEPIPMSNEAYTLPALQRAIEYIETNVQPVEK
jgi:hypothetical protein